jgi:hypothetical protein
MKTLCTSIVLCVMTVAVNSHGQCDSLGDKTLCVYTLTPSQAAAFSTTDSAVSSFWTTDWAGRDYVQLIPPDNCYPGACNFVGGATDAQMTIKAGGTARGLYLYVEVQDDIWVDRASRLDIGADVVELFFDDSSAAVIGACGIDCRIGIYGSYLSYTTSEFMVWMGPTNPPANLIHNYYNSMGDWGMYEPTWEGVFAQYGLRVEIITVDATHRVQEWFIPWTSFGNGGFPLGTAMAGKRLGFAGGYDDRDGDSGTTTVDKLRFTGKDPWASDANYWGDLLIAADMPPVESATGVTAPARAVGLSTSRVVATECYSLRGERLPASTAPALIVKRQANGTHLTMSIAQRGRQP